MQTMSVTAAVKTSSDAPQQNKTAPEGTSTQATTGPPQTTQPSDNAHVTAESDMATPTNMQGKKGKAGVGTKKKTADGVPKLKKNGGLRKPRAVKRKMGEVAEVPEAKKAAS